jgi:tetratricopeptide (TPR) repeat protein
MVSCQLGAQRHIADSLFASGKYTEAIANYKNVNPSAYNSFQIARIYSQLGNNTKAVENYKSGLEIDSLNVTARFEYGKALLATNKKNEALTVFDNLVKEQQTTAAYHYYLGKAKESMEGASAAIPHYEQAVVLNPEFANARTELITGLLMTRDFNKAIAVAQKGLKLSPDNIVLHSLLGQCYYYNNEFKDAIKHLKIVDEAGLITEGLIKILGAASYQERLYKDSIAYYEIGNNTFLQSSASYMMIAKNHLKLENYKEAISNMDAAIVLKQPSLNQEYMQMAAIYYQMEDDKRMLEYLKKAKIEDPNDGVSAYQYCQAYDRLYTDITTKINNYKDFVERFPKDPYVDLANARISDLTKERFLQPKK